jgi:leader peptidase (prepilin peptidase)/N-methyltransferase
MHPVAGLATAALGAAAGPFLAGLTIRVPALGRALEPEPGRVRDPGPVPGGPVPGAAGWLPAGWWSGAGAQPRRRLLLSGLAAAGCGLAGLGVGAGAALPAYLWFGLAAGVLTVIDLEHQRLPNRIVYPTYAAGLVLLALAAAVDSAWPAYLRGLTAMALLYVLFLLLALVSPGALGFGDVKLAGLLGLYLGYLGAGRLALGLAAGVLLGAVAALALLAARRAGWRTQLAYGPALLAGSVLAVGVGQPLLDGYLGAAGLR